MNDSHDPERPGSLPEDWQSPSDDEKEAAARLRDALQRAPDKADPDLEFIRALRSAANPAPIEPQRHEALLGAALARRPRRHVYPLFAAASAVAIAAAVALVFGLPEKDADVPPHSSARAIPCRSAAGLFDTSFPVTGGTSARVDRVAMAREREMRDNLFAQWQVP